MSCQHNSLTGCTVCNLRAEAKDNDRLREELEEAKLDACALRFALREIVDLGEDEEHEATDPEDLFFEALNIANEALAPKGASSLKCEESKP